MTVRALRLSSPWLAVNGTGSLPLATIFSAPFFPASSVSSSQMRQAACFTTNSKRASNIGYSITDASQRRIGAPCSGSPISTRSLGWLCTTSAVVLGFLGIQPTPLPSFWSSSGPPVVVAHDCVPDCPGCRRQCWVAFWPYLILDT